MNWITQGVVGLWLVFVLTTEAYSETVRLVFRGKKHQLVELLQTKGIKPFDFGLTLKQKQRIYSLTQGRVNFGDLYYVDVTNLDRYQHWTRLPQYRGTIYKNVPPPFESGDPELANEWWIDKIKAQQAWPLTQGGEGITIADCDAGYYVDENDLAPNLLMEHAYDLSDSDDPFNVSDGRFVFHGTAVAAIMSAVMDGQGTNGIAYQSKIVPLQNFNYSSNDDLDKEEATTRCILRALTIDGVDIIVLENQTATGSSETFEGTREAVKLALEAGIVIVSAAGNYQRELSVEAQYDTGSIIVGALDQSGKKASFSNFGSRVEIAAFGEKLKTLYGPDGRLGYFGGTSGATPQVAAAVALMLDVNETLTPEQIKQILIATRIESPEAADVGGQLDVKAAVEKAKEMPRNVQAMQRNLAKRKKIQALLVEP